MMILGFTLLAVIIIVMTLVFDFVNGFNDSANSISTVVATKVLSPFRAVLMAATFNFFGIFIWHGIAKTIGTGIIDKDQSLIWNHLLLILFCAVLAAIIWDLITWWFGIPTSSSHALVGGLIGAGVALAGLGAIVWSGTGKTILFIVISPVVGMITAFFLTSLVMNVARKKSRHVVNSWSRRLQLASAATLSLTHGANDAQKGMGIIALVILINAGQQNASFDLPPWVQLACQTAISFGTFFGGWRIVKTMATRITKLDASQGFAAETGAASMLFATAALGIPVSTTHTISGAIMGVGATRRLSAVRWGVGRRIVIAWIVTIPATASISGILFLALHALGVH